MVSKGHATFVDGHQEDILWREKNGSNIMFCIESGVYFFINKVMESTNGKVFYFEERLYKVRLDDSEYASLGLNMEEVKTIEKVHLAT